MASAGREAVPIVQRAQACQLDADPTRSLEVQHPFSGALPLELWTACIWPRLDHTARASLKSSCRAGNALCNQLIDSIHLRLGCPDGASSTACANLHPFDPSLAAAAGSFMRRLPQLATLTLDSGASPLELWLTRDGGLAGGPPCVPVHSLVLACRHPDPLPKPALRNLLAALPALQQLQLSVVHPPDSLGAELAKRCPQLTQLTFHMLQAFTPDTSPDPQEASAHPQPHVSPTGHAAADAAVVVLPAALRSLSAVSALRSLECRYEYNSDGPAACLESAALIASLQVLRLEHPDDHSATAAELAPLSSLSALTSLCLPALSMVGEADAGAGAGAAGAPGAYAGGTAPPPSDVQSSALQPLLLGALTRLEELRLERMPLTRALWDGLLVHMPALRCAAFAWVDECIDSAGGGGDAGAATQGGGLRPLPQLRELAFDVAAVTTPPSALLPLLRALPGLTAIQCTLVVGNISTADFCRQARALADVERELDRCAAAAAAAADGGAAGVCVPLELVLRGTACDVAAKLRAVVAGGAFAHVGRPRLRLYAGELAEAVVDAAMGELLGGAFRHSECVEFLWADVCDLVGSAWARALAQPARRCVRFLGISDGLSVPTLHGLAVRLAQAAGGAQGGGGGGAWARPTPGVRGAGRGGGGGLGDGRGAAAVIEVQHCDGIDGDAARQLAQLSAAHPGVEVRVVVRAD